MLGCSLLNHIVKFIYTGFLLTQLSLLHSVLEGHLMMECYITICDYLPYNAFSVNNGIESTS